MQKRGWTRLASALGALALSLGGCTSVAQISNLSEEDCSQGFERQLSEILVQQGEAPEAAGEMAERTRRMLAYGVLGPRPFLVSSASGTDYTFFVQKKKSGCLLRLYGKQKGFMTYTNNLTYIATRPLAQCACAE